MSNELSIKGVDKAELLAAFYNNSKFQGYGASDPGASPEPMTKAEAQRIIGEGQLTFDYLRGRVLKIDLGGDTLRGWHDSTPSDFERIFGAGAATRIVEGVKKGIIAPSVNRAAETYNCGHPSFR